MRPRDAIEHPADRREREEAERARLERAKDIHDRTLRKAYAAVASTPEGRIVLREWIRDFTAAMASAQFRGNSQDFYNLGRAYQAEEIRKTLQQVLPREMFLEIMYPKEAGDGSE